MGILRGGARAVTALVVATALVFTGIGGAPVAAAQDSREQLAFPGDAPSEVITRYQRIAEVAYEEGDFNKAFWHYRKELAPRGDKYAQYMVGYMTHHGEGIPRDEIQAAAWFSLAAERGHPQIVDVVQQYRSRLSAQQLQSAQARSVELKNEIGDIALTRKLLRRDMQRLRETAGFRTKRNRCGENGWVISAVPGISGSMSSDKFCQFLNERIERRLAYLGGYVTYGELELLPDDEDAENSSEQE